MQKKRREQFLYQWIRAVVAVAVSSATLLFEQCARWNACQQMLHACSYCIHVHALLPFHTPLSFCIQHCKENRTCALHPVLLAFTSSSCRHVFAKLIFYLPPNVGNSGAKTTSSLHNLTGQVYRHPAYQSHCLAYSHTCICAYKPRPAHSLGNTVAAAITIFSGGSSVIWFVLTW